MIRTESSWVPHRNLGPISCRPCDVTDMFFDAGPTVHGLKVETPPSRRGPDREAIRQFHDFVPVVIVMVRGARRSFAGDHGVDQHFCGRTTSTAWYGAIVTGIHLRQDHLRRPLDKMRVLRVERDDERITPLRTRVGLPWKLRGASGGCPCRTDLCGALVGWRGSNFSSLAAGLAWCSRWRRALATAPRSTRMNNHSSRRIRSRCVDEMEGYDSRGHGPRLGVGIKGFFDRLLGHDYIPAAVK